MASNLITLSKKRLSLGTSIILSVIFGIMYVGLGTAYLGFFDPSADPLALGLVLLMAFSGWLGLLIFLISLWKRFGVFSFPSHILIIFTIAITCSILTWPLLISLMYSLDSLLIAICIFPAFFVALVAYFMYGTAMRTVQSP